MGFLCFWCLVWVKFWISGKVKSVFFHCLMKVFERYTCYPSEFDCSDVVSKCVVITFYEFYITSTIIF